MSERWQARGSAQNRCQATGASGQQVTRLPKCAGEPDEREPDEGSRVRAVYCFEQGDPQGFNLEATRAVERLLAGNVAVNLRIRELSETHGSCIEMLEAQAGLDADHGTTRIEVGGMATQRRQLGDARGLVPWLA